MGDVQVHPDYDRLVSARVAVAPVGNETIHDLSAVSFGGVLQRVLVGPETLDVPAILRSSLEDALTRKGYETRPDDGGEGAVCRLSVEEWSSDRVSSSSMRIVYRVELDSVSTGERLFSGRYSYTLIEDSGEPRAGDIPTALAQSVQTALSALPRAPE